MARGFLNQKLGKRNGRRAELQHAKNEAGNAGRRPKTREARDWPERHIPSRKTC